MGKSTLGNYLLDPSRQKKHFTVAKDNKPETQYTQSEKGTFTGPAIEALGYSSVHLSVIDTPGLNESDAADLKHMIGIVEQLEKEQEITACIIVVKFDSKIDTQYRKTIEYYSQLLPSLFEKNVFIVMTDYATDPRTIAMREQRGIDEKDITENALTTIVRSAKLSYSSPIVFKIDCLPYEDDPMEVAYSEGVRNSILEYIMQLQPINSANLKVAKTEYLIHVDREQIKNYEGKINGYKQRLIELNQHSKTVLNTIQDKESKVAQWNAQIDSISGELKDKDTSDLVTANTWSVDAEWKFLKTQQKGCELESEWKIANVNLWTNGKCKWSDVEESDYMFKGRVKGRFSRGLYANVMLETEKCMKYATEIHQFKEELESAKLKHKSELEDLHVYREKQDKYKKDIATFEGFIQEKRAKIKDLKGAWLTVPEARRRLDILTT